MKLEEKLARLPEGPGVYFMKARGGAILYIGKASRLSDRVGSYFQRSAALTPRIRHMVDQVADIETIVTGTELEALILENNLIKKHRPRYNVVLRDDKNYPYLRLALKDDFPRPEIVRRVKPDGAIYYGPYVPTNALRETMRVLRRLFPLPNCNIVIDGKAERPCIEYEIKRCLAPCTGYQSREDYREMIGQLKLFLEGKDRELLTALRSRMKFHSDRQEYEEAARIRDQIAKIERTLEAQRVATTRQIDLDVVAMARSGGLLDLQVLFIRGGMVTGRKDFFMTEMADATDEEVITGFLQRFYDKEITVPPEVVIPAMPFDPELLTEWLSDRRGEAVELTAPVSVTGERIRSDAAVRAVLRLAEENAASALEGHLAERHLGTIALQELKNRLGLSRLPERIEAFDISNIMGNLAVGSMVVFEDGQPRKSAYRHFKIRTIEGANDFGMIEEVVRRHYAGVMENKQPLPDLVLIDGGKGQLSSALAALAPLGITGRDVIGLAKAKGEKFERVFLPGRPDAVPLDPASPATHLLQRVRDEAHRFAITHHRKLRGKGMVLSELDGLPGIGIARKRALLKRFGGLDGIRQASVEELTEVKGITQKLAEAILRTLYREQAPPPDRPEMKIVRHES
jgi:excinuclease ABC subunit C